MTAVLEPSAMRTVGVSPVNHGSGWLAPRAERPRSRAVKENAGGTPRAGNPSRFDDYRILLELRGASYVGVIDEQTGVLVAEFGESSTEADTVAALATMARVMGRDRKVDDVMVTTKGQFHVLRPVPAHGRTESLLVYVRLERGQANLAAARRAMAALGQRGSTTVSIPVQRPSRPDLRLVAGSMSTSAPQACLPLRRARVMPTRLATVEQRDVVASAPVAVAAETTMFGVAVDPVQESMPPSSSRAGVQAWTSDVSTMRKLLSRLRQSA